MIDTRDSSLFGTRNPMEGEVRIPSGAPSRAFSTRRAGKIGGDTIIRAMEPMHDRSNGLGGGSRGMVFILILRTAMPSICSTTMSPRGMTASIT